MRAYDAAGRLTMAREGTMSEVTITRDAEGRITEMDRVDGLTLTKAVAPSDAVRTFDAASQVQSFTYDALGRRTSASGNMYEWSPSGRLTSYQGQLKTVGFTYDGRGHRIRRTEGGSTTEFVINYALDVPSPSVERVGGMAVGFNIHTPDGTLLYSIDESDQPRYYHFDEAGNTRFLTDAAGAVIATYLYGPYGELLSQSGVTDNPYTWQGASSVTREPDGLYYMRSRYYDSETGSFISRAEDPAPTPTRANPRQYAARNPLSNVAPTGERSEPVENVLYAVIADPPVTPRDFIDNSCPAVGLAFGTGAVAEGLAAAVSAASGKGSLRDAVLLATELLSGIFVPPVMIAPEPSTTVPRDRRSSTAKFAPPIPAPKEAPPPRTQRRARRSTPQDTKAFIGLFIQIFGETPEPDVPGSQFTQPPPKQPPPEEPELDDDAVAPYLQGIVVIS